MSTTLWLRCPSGWPPLSQEKLLRHCRPIQWGVRKVKKLDSARLDVPPAVSVRGRAIPEECLLQLSCPRATRPSAINSPRFGWPQVLPAHYCSVSVGRSVGRPPVSFSLCLCRRWVGRTTSRSCSFDAMQRGGRESVVSCPRASCSFCRRKDAAMVGLVSFPSRDGWPAGQTTKRDESGNLPTARLSYKSVCFASLAIRSI